MICSTTYRTLLSLAGSAILTLGTLGVLQASAQGDGPHGQAVSYHAEDLAKPAYAARIYRRIQKAAEKVCDNAPLYNLGERNLLRRCVDESVAKAVADINHPQLNALHSATIKQWQAVNAQPQKPQA